MQWADDNDVMYAVRMPYKVFLLHLDLVAIQASLWYYKSDICLEALPAD